MTLSPAVYVIGALAFFALGVCLAVEASKPSHRRSSNTMLVMASVMLFGLIMVATLLLLVGRVA